MKNSLLKSIAAVAIAASCTAAMGEMMDRPIGIKIGERMTLKPYLSFSVAYDSNVEGRKDAMTMWCGRVTPASA